MRKAKLTCPDEVLVASGLTEGDCRAALATHRPREAQPGLDELAAKANEGALTEGDVNNTTSTSNCLDSQLKFVP